MQAAAKIVNDFAQLIDGKINHSSELNRKSLIIRNVYKAPDPDIIPVLNRNHNAHRNHYIHHYKHCEAGTITDSETESWALTLVLFFKNRLMASCYTSKRTSVEIKIKPSQPNTKL